MTMNEKIICGCNHGRSYDIPTMLVEETVNPFGPEDFEEEIWFMVEWISSLNNMLHRISLSRSEILMGKRFSKSAGIEGFKD